MVQSYPLEWLDTLISLTLNPRKIYLAELSKDDLQALSDKVVVETLQIQSELRNQVFALHKENQIRLLVQKYHSTFIILLDILTEYKTIEGYLKEEHSNIFTTVAACLDELLFFIEIRFGNYLSLEERVPSAYLSVSRKELNIRVDRLQKKLNADIADPNFTAIVLDYLYRFINTKKTETITFRELLYYKKLIQKLEQLGPENNHTSIYSALNELLIYMNFNARKYINYFTRSVSLKINALDTKAERIDSLHFHYKEFNHIQSQHKFQLYPEHENIKSILGNWFQQEILYTEKAMQLSQQDIRVLKKPDNPPQKIMEKITVNLSSDQIALILRACDESRILGARSLSHVFKMIVPYLSTPGKQELSADSVRSKSYSAEDRDKQIVVAVLEKLITKVNTY